MLYSGGEGDTDTGGDKDKGGDTDTGGDTVVVGVIQTLGDTGLKNSKTCCSKVACWKSN